MHCIDALGVSEVGVFSVFLPTPCGDTDIMDVKVSLLIMQEEERGNVFVLIMFI